MSNNLTIKILEVSGLELAAQYVSLPVGNIRPRMSILTSSGVLTSESLQRLSRLISLGDGHAKIMRQVVIHMEITGPRHWWQQFSTNRTGMEMYSGSTMHTLLKDGVGPYSFTPETKYGPFLTGALEDQDLTRAKANLPEGYLQTRLCLVSYQTLRRIVFQRRGHKLPEWAEFIRAVWECPYADELIFVEPRNPWRKLWEGVLTDEELPWVCWSQHPEELDCAFCGCEHPHHDPGCPYTKAQSMMIKEIANVVTE